MTQDRVYQAGLAPVGGFVLLALFVPALCWISLSAKSRTATRRLNDAIKIYGIGGRNDPDYIVYQDIYIGRIPSGAFFAIAVLTLMNVYMSLLTIYTPEFLSPPKFLANFLLLGTNYGIPSSKETDRYILQTFDVICFSYLGWYVWTVSTIFSRIITMEIVPSTYYSVLIRLVIATILSVMFRHLWDSIPAYGARFSAEAIGFGVGLFPTSALHWMRRYLHRYLLSDTEITDEFSLDLIQGISPFRKLRLYEMGMDNCANLATQNPLILFATSKLRLMEVLDWIGQAQLLILVGKKKFQILQENGYRTGIDFDRGSQSGALSTLAALINYTEPQLLDVCRGLQKNPCYIRLLSLTGKVTTEAARADLVLRQPMDEPSEAANSIESA